MASPTGTETPGATRLPFQLRRVGGAGRLALAGETVLGWIHVDRLELEVPDAATAGFDTAGPAERFQRRRTQLVVASLRVDQRALEARVVASAGALALQGVTALSARLADGHISVTARVADGLAAADVSFRVRCAPSGLGVRIVCGDIFVHGHLPTPAPALAHRVVATVLGAVEVRDPRDSRDPRDGRETSSAADDDPSSGLPRSRGLCDVELDPLPALLWRLLPARGWRLPAIGGLELVAVRISRAGLAVSYAPAGQRPAGDDGSPGAVEAAQLVVAHDAMHSADEMLRRGHLDDAMRGYRALLAAGGPDQPVLLARILAVAAARPTWFVDGLELARQALARWPDYGPAHATLASIGLAKSDARDAAAQLGRLAETCAEAGDDAAGALAALAAARLLRVLDPRGATALYELALTHHPGLGEAVDALADRYAEESRWHDLVRLHRARLAATTDRSRVVRDHLRLADILAGRLGDRRGARGELERARELAPDDGAVHQALADLAETTGDDVEAAAALAEVARLAHERRDRRVEAQAWARRGQLLERTGDLLGADAAWTAALGVDADDLDVMRGAARTRARRGDSAGAATLWRKVLGRGLPATDAATASLELARVLGELGDSDGARAAIADAAVGSAETAADAHQLLAELLSRGPEGGDAQGAAAELDAAIAALVTAAEQAFSGTTGTGVASPGDDRGNARGAESERMLGRAAVLALERARLNDALGDDGAAIADLRRAHTLASTRAPEVARDAARALLDRTATDANAQREWIDALLATRPPDSERARLLVRRARLRLDESPGNVAAALGDVSEALALTGSGVGDGASVDDDTRAEALVVQAAILANTGDRKGSAQALAARARLPRALVDRAAAETDAAAAWLAADEPAAALPHSSRAARELDEPIGVPPALRRRILATLGEAAWRQRAWHDVVRAASALLGDPAAAADHGTSDAEVASMRAVLRYRLAVAIEKLGDPARARIELDGVLDDEHTPAELRAHAHRLLADLCERAGDHLRAARSLEAFAGDPNTGASAAVRADAWYRAAELFRRAGDVESGARDTDRQPAHLDDSARCLEGALRLVEDHIPALDALEVVERAQGNLERVAVILGRKIAASARRPGRQKALLQRLAILQLQLGRREVAREAYRRALEIDPDDRTALRFLADEARADGDRGGAANLYERLAGPLPGDGDEEPATIASARASAATGLAMLVADARSGDAADASWAEAWIPRARAVADGALELVPDDDLRRIVDGLAGAPASASNGGAPSPGGARIRAVSLQRQAGEARVSGRLDVAAASLAAAVALEPHDTELLRDFAEVLADQGDWTSYADVLSRLALAAGDTKGAGLGPRRAEVLLELADVCYDRLGDLARARIAMRAAADSHGPGARRDATLRQLASETFTRAEFADALGAYEAIAPARRTAIDRVAMATAHHRLGRDTTAIMMLEEARTSGTLSDEGAMLLFALHTERTRAAELAAALEHAAANSPPPEARARLLEALALYRDRVADADATARVSARLETLGGTDSDEVLAVANFFASTNPVNPVPVNPVPVPVPVPDLPPIPSLSPPPSPPPSLPPSPSPATATAAVAAYDASAATEAARRAFATVPSNTTSRVDDDWQMPTTAATAAAAADASDLAATASLTERQSSTGRSHAADLERAAEAAAASGDPHTAADLLADAVAARVAAGGDEHEVLGAVGNLESIAGEASDVVVRALFNASARAAAPLAVTLLRRAAIAAERGLGDDVIAADALARAHSLALDDVAVLDELATVLLRSGDVIRLADACERTTRATTGRAAARAYYQLGHIHRDSFNDVRRSAEHFAAAHKADPDLAEVWLPLANALAADDDLAGARALYERAITLPALSDQERSWALARLEALGSDPDVVSGEIGRLAPPPSPSPSPTDPDERTTDVVDTELVMAAVAQTLTDMMTAVATGFTEAMTAAVSGEELPSHAASFAPRIEVVEESVDEAQIESEAETVPAPVAETAPPPSSGPVPIAADAVPGAEPDLAALEELYSHNGDWEALTEILGQRIVNTPDRKDRAELWHRRGRLYRDVLHREGETYRCLREAHACDPDDADIAHALRSVAMARAEWALAAQLLYREIAAAPSTRDRAALHFELALIYDEKLLEPEQARVNYEQALELDPEIPAAPRPLAQIYELAARHADAARLWERAAELARPADRPTLLLRASAAAGRAVDLPAARRLAETAALAADANDDAEGAREARNEAARLAPADDRPERALAVASGDDERVTALETALVAAQARGDVLLADRHASALLDHDPSNGLAFRHLAGNAEGAGDWPMLTALLTSRAMSIGDPAERATLWFEIGRVHEIHRHDHIAAAAAFDRALDADADHPGALDARAALAFSTQDWERADALYARVVPAKSILPRELLLLRRVAIAETRGRFAEALAIARDAAATEGASRDAFAATIKLGIRTGDYASAAVAARAALELMPPDDATQLTEARLELADLVRMSQDAAGAVELYEQVLVDEARNLRALQALADLYQQQHNLAAAARTVRNLATLADVPARRAELIWRLGELQLRQGEVADADDEFLRASDLDPGHQPTLRRLIDVYWRADEPPLLLDVCTDLAQQGQLLVEATDRTTLARAMVAAAVSAALNLAAGIATHLGADAAPLIAKVLAELGPEHRELSLDAAAGGLRELARKGQGPKVSEIVDAAADLEGDAGDAIATAMTG